MKAIIANVALAAFLAISGAAWAEDSCVATCIETSVTCAHDAADAFELCSEDLGCDALRQEYRDACLVRDRDEQQCRDARQAFRSCLSPCKAALADDGAQCKSELQACFADECEVQERWRRLFERLRRDR